MNLKFLKLLYLILFFSLIGCNLIKLDPIDQAVVIIKTELSSPNTFKKISGQTIWRGSTSAGLPAYVVSVLFESANSSGSNKRRCLYVTYHETKEKRLMWSKDFGVKDFSETPTLCDDSASMESRKKIVDELIDLNFRHQTIR